MPFPLLSLPYGFRRRLVELSTPFEAYSIQVAAPHVIPFCQPVKITTQNDYSTNYLELDGRNNQYYDKFDNPVTIGEHELRVLRFGFRVKDLLKMDIVFNHFIFSHSDWLYFIRCHIDFAFVKKLCSNLSTKLSTEADFHFPGLQFENCSYGADITTFALCDSLFKHVKKIRCLPFPALPEGVNGLLNSNLTGLFQVELRLTSLNMLDIDPNALLKFFLAQHCEFFFEIDLQIINPDEEIQKKVNAMLSNNFEFEPYVVMPWHIMRDLPAARYLEIYYPSKRFMRYKLVKKE